MRLLLLTSVYPSPRRPTKGTFNREMIRGLRSTGNDVRVVVPIPWTDLVLAAPTGRREDDATYPVWWYPPRLQHDSRHHWMRRTVLRAVRHRTTHWRPDALIGYWTHPDGTVTVEAARNLGVPAVLIVGGSDVRVLAQEANAGRRAIITQTLQRADRVLAVGAGLRTEIIALGLPPERIGVLERGVDRSRFHPGSQDEARRRLALPVDRPVFLWVGRMVAVKGLDILLAAWREVQVHPSRPMLILAGDGELRGRLERQARDLRESVRFVGTVAHETLPEWYHAADAIVLPSISEGVPNVLLEGLACGTPFIASDVGGIPDLAREDCAVVPAGDVAALAAALLRRLDGAARQARTVGDVLDCGEAARRLHRELESVAGHARPVGAVA
jgi:glycosyltransferase involved in cell wall biosynthesis